MTRRRTHEETVTIGPCKDLGRVTAARLTDVVDNLLHPGLDLSIDIKFHLDASRARALLPSASAFRPNHHGFGRQARLAHPSR
jgi:hypothetical protein